MTSKWKKISDVSVNDHQTIRPALDYVDGKAIIGVGDKRYQTYSCRNEDEDDRHEHRTVNYCVTSDGDMFMLCPSELNKRKWFYEGKGQFEVGRWHYQDVRRFTREAKKGKVKIPDKRLLLDHMIELTRKATYFEDERAHSFFSLYALYTGFFPMWDTAPILELWGKIGTGKSRLFLLGKELFFNPLLVTDSSNASIYREIEAKRGIFMFDEGEEIGKTEKGKAIENAMLAGHTKGVTVPRQERRSDGKYDAFYFDIYGPKCIASIKGLSGDAIRSRTIRIVTVRAPFDFESIVNTKECQEVRNQLYRTWLTGFAEVQECSSLLGDVGLRLRHLDVWRGILSVAKWIGEDTFNEVSEFARDKASELDADLSISSPDVPIVDALIDLVKDKGDGLYTLEDISPWLEESPENPKVLGQQLSRMGVPASKPVARGTKRPRGRELKLEHLEKIKERLQ